MKKNLLFCILFLFVLFPYPVYAFGDSSVSGYQLGAEDEINIYVWRNESLSFDKVIVRSDGKISFPFLGEIKVAGLTCGELEDKISQSLLPYIKNPRVSVNLAKKRLFRVCIVGEIKKPGVYDVRKSESTISEVVALSEGVTDKAALHRCLIERGNNTIEVNLESLLKRGDIRCNVPIYEGDTIVIPQMNNRIAVIGEVTKPGVYELKEGDTLFEAITSAGWFNNKARVSSIDIIRHAEKNKVERIHVNIRRMDKIQDDNTNDSLFRQTVLKNGDIIYVPLISGPSLTDIYQVFSSIYFIRAYIPLP